MQNETETDIEANRYEAETAMAKDNDTESWRNKRIRRAIVKCTREIEKSGDNKSETKDK